jgi:hypothetical protein
MADVKSTEVKARKADSETWRRLRWGAAFIASFVFALCFYGGLLWLAIDLARKVIGSIDFRH